VIILSARDETEVKVKCLTIVANDYVSKPFRV
jgi:DNA-binding response OmpR family regulator